MNKNLKYLSDVIEVADVRWFNIKAGFARSKVGRKIDAIRNRKSALEKRNIELHEVIARQTKRLTLVQNAINDLVRTVGSSEFTREQIANMTTAEFVKCEAKIDRDIQDGKVFLEK